MYRNLFQIYKNIQGEKIKWAEFNSIFHLLEMLD